MKSKIAGTIYGQFIGDALGTRYEFNSSKLATKNIDDDIIDGFLPILGQGPFNVLPGQVTDDTEMAVALLYSILEKGTFDKDYTAKKYIKWIKSKPFDMGNTTRNALFNTESYNDILYNVKKYNQTSLSNGCLMRISPLALLGIKLHDDILISYCAQDTLMTHSHNIAIDAVCVYVIAIKTAISTNNKKTIYDKAYKTANTSIIKKILNDSIKKPSPVITDDGTYTTHDSKHIGYLGISLQNAFYELFNGHSFYYSMLDTMKRGGDTDTNGCITGALLGAYYGIENIPSKWINSVNVKTNRSLYYNEIDQTKINFLIDKMFELINK